MFLMIEKIILAKMKTAMGWAPGVGDGIFAPGGSISNMYGMNMARHHKFPEIKKKGMGSCGDLALFQSESGHYSINKGAALLGLGTDAIYKVRNNKDYQMDAGHLREQIQKARADGRTPFLVNATCATTVFGSFDDLEMLSDVCQQEKMWLHLDAALGGSMVLSDKHRHLMKGSHLADSITWNPHKLLGVPLQCSAILTKHESLLTEAHAANAKYLFQKDKLNIQHDTGDKSIQCGRKVDVLKLWMAWKVQGENGFAARIDRMMEISQYLRDEIIRRGQKDGSLELVSEPYMSNVCFWFIPPSARGPNAPNKGTPEWNA